MGSISNLLVAKVLNILLMTYAPFSPWIINSTPDSPLHKKMVPLPVKNDSSVGGDISIFGDMTYSFPIDSMVMGSPCRVLFIACCPWTTFNIYHINKIFDFLQDSTEKSFFSLFTLNPDKSSVFEHGHLADI